MRKMEYTLYFIIDVEVLTTRKKQLYVPWSSGNPLKSCEQLWNWTVQLEEDWTVVKLCAASLTARTQEYFNLPILEVIVVFIFSSLKHANTQTIFCTVSGFLLDELWVRFPSISVMHPFLQLLNWGWVVSAYALLLPLHNECLFT